MPPDVERQEPVQLTPEEIAWLRARRVEWERTKWLGRLVMKVVIYVGGAVVGIVGFGESIVKMVKMLGKG